jgi:hypothetical protein
VRATPSSRFRNRLSSRRCCTSRAEGDASANAQESRFKIRLANSEGRRSTASYLIQRRYAWRGYSTASPTSSPAPNVVTLAAFDQDALVATISVGMDSQAGLVVEKLYPAEVAALRAERDVSLCEFTRLAVDSLVRSRAVLAAIFHIAYIHARHLRHATDLLIEVNPRHVKFYISMLGFEVAAAERMDPRVSAPAVLLRLKLAYASPRSRAGAASANARAKHACSIRCFFRSRKSAASKGGLRAMD